MTTALDDWGNQQHGREGNAHDETELPHEADDADADSLGDGSSSSDAEHTESAESSARADEALAKKRKQGTQIIMAAGGLCLALVVGVVGFAFMKKGQPAQQPEVAEQSAPSTDAAQPGTQPGSETFSVAVATPVQPPAPLVLDEAAEGTQAAALPGETQAALAGPRAGGEPGAGAVPAGAEVSTSASGPTASRLAALSAPAIAGATPTAAKADEQAAITAALRGELVSMRAELSEKAQALDALRREVSSLQAQVAAKPSTPRSAAATAAPKAPVRQVASSTPPLYEMKKSSVPASPAVVLVTEAVVPNTNMTPAVGSMQAVSMKGKVRSDFRIYAAVDGRFWVVGPDNEPVQIGARSPLSDGSRVTSIDAEKNIIYTTAGEIR